MSDQARHVSWKFITLFLVAHVLFSLVVNFMLFASDVFNPVIRATQGLVSITLIANAFGLLLIAGALFLWIGRLRPQDLGLEARKVANGLGITLAIWALAQGLGLIVAFASQGEVVPDPLWARFGIPFVLGLLLSQLLGNALLEEIEFRGFLLPQLYHKLGHSQPAKRTALAALISTLIFTLLHLPNRIAMGYTATEIWQSSLFVMALGLVFCAVYLWTRNLFVATGVHALVNAPTMLVALPVPGVVLVAIATVIVLGGPLALRRTRQSRLERAERATARSH